MLQYFKKIILSCLCIIASTYLFSQSEFQSTDKRSIIKLNIPALAFKNFSVQYEYALKPWHSIGLGIRYRPESGVPLQNFLKNYIKDPIYKSGLAMSSLGNLGITPEYKYYVGKKKPLQGFYMSLFLSYNHYTGNVPIKYSTYDTSNNKSYDKLAMFNGSANTYTIGFQVGAQWNLSKRLVLDWWILGPNYGISDGVFVNTTPINGIDERAYLYNELSIIKRTIPLLV